MNNYDFYAVLLGNPGLYIAMLCGSFVLHYLIFRKVIITLLDPYILPAVFSVFCVATVTFLFVALDTISIPVFISFTVTQLAFWFGLFAFPSLKIFVNDKIRNPQLNDFGTMPGRGQKTLLFYLSSFIYLSTQFAIYYFKGIPLLMASRLELFSDAQGAGVLGRIADVTVVCALYTFFSVVRFDYVRRSELRKYFVMAMIFATFILSGSKSAFLTILFTFWAYIVFEALKNGNYSSHIAQLKRHTKKVIILSVAMVLVVILLQTRQNDQGALFLFGLRLVHSADVFWYAYPNNIYLTLDNSHPFRALFTDVLGMLRIYQWNEMPQAIGITLKNIHHPSKLLEGPNPRHNVFGLVYFGFVGAPILSFSLGLLLSFVRNVLPRMMNRSVISGVVFAYLALRISSVESDPTLSVMSVNNFIFIFPIIMISLLIVTTLTRKRPVMTAIDNPAKD